MKPLTIGLVGLGGFGKFLLRALEKTPNILVVGVADQYLEGDSFYQDIPTYNTWEDMASDTEMEALCIATPPSTHALISTAAMKLGLHVLIEKPLAINPEDARQIIQVSRETGKVAMVNFMQRFNPILSSIKSMYSEGMLGEFEHFVVHNYAQDQSLPVNHWFWDSEISGGILIEHAVHFIDIVHWFLKKPVIQDVYGWQQLRENGIRDRMGLTAEYQSGMIANHYHSFSRPDFFEQTKLMLKFTLAEFDLNGWIPESGYFTLLGAESMIDELNANTLFSEVTMNTVDSIPVRGINYKYDTQLSGTLHTTESKEILYLNALTNIFNDFYYTITNSNHQPVVDLQDGLEALNIAYMATKKATK